MWWVRRDFRLADNPALRAAVDEGEAVLPLFVLDPVLLRSSGTARRAWIFAALHALDTDLRDGGGPGLSVVEGRPADVVPRVAQQSEATTVHVAADFAPYGRRRDERVAEALERHRITLRRTGSAYAVAPGTLSNGGGTPYSVFSPFHRAWLEHGVHDPASGVRAEEVDWLETDDQATPPDPEPGLVGRAGEGPALRAWREWRERETEGVADYKELHNLPGPNATSQLSIGLRYGHLHPRTLLADLAPVRSPGSLALARQLAWRDFYGDVLRPRPDAVDAPIRPEFARMPVDEPEPGSLAGERLAAWQQGRTGFPLVDAGMRQLLAERWMHNRVRMVVASFLVKDLHLGWTHGAAYFMAHLYDGDIAQNQLNWQWVAGCGNDPAPFYRIFNPVLQSEKFDPDGIYIRRYVPELADVPDEHLHQPWRAPGGVPAGYPEPIVDHAAERKESLDRYALVKG